MTGALWVRILERIWFSLKGNGAQRKVAWRAGSVKDAIKGFKNFIMTQCLQFLIDGSITSMTRENLILSRILTHKPSVKLESTKQA